jgi:hypothetical protein
MGEHSTARQAWWEAFYDRGRPLSHRVADHCATLFQPSRLPTRLSRPRGCRASLAARLSPVYDQDLPPSGLQAPQPSSPPVQPILGAQLPSPVTSSGIAQRSLPLSDQSS